MGEAREEESEGEGVGWDEHETKNITKSFEAFLSSKRTIISQRFTQIAFGVSQLSQTFQNSPELIVT